MKIVDNFKKQGIYWGLSLFLMMTFCLLGSHISMAQNTIFVKSGVTDGDIITVGTETGAAYTTLKEAVAHATTGDIVKLTEDVTEAGTVTHPYGAKCCVVHDGITIDGDGHSLTVTGISGGYTCAIYTKGGTIRNLTVTGGFRVIFSGGSSSDINIDNCVIDAGSTGAYTFNSDAAGPYALNITNSTLKGWTSYTMGYSSSTISNNTFDKCSYLNYGYYRPYIPTVCESCSFTSDVWVDASTPYRLDDYGNPQGDGYVLFNNCSYNGSVLTEDNVDNLLDHDWGASTVWSTGSEVQGYLVPAEPMTTNVDGKVTGGVFSGDVDYLNTIVAPGYGAVALGTTPETYRVTPVYYIHFNASGGTGTMADTYVPREAPNNVYTVPTCTFTHTVPFKNWTTQPNGGGTDVAVDAVMTLTSDTTLYAKWSCVAMIGNTPYATLPEAITAATSGATITIVDNITPDAVANITLDKSLTITAETPGKYTIADHHFTLSGNTVEVTVSNLNFSGDSYINANNGKGLTVDHVNATVNPAKVPNNSRSAFIVLSTSENTTGLNFTLTNSNIVNTFGTDYYGAYVFGWAFLSSANISNNTFGSADYRCHFVAVKLMNVTDGTEYHFSDNTFYGTTDYYFAAFDLYQNNSRANSYTAWGENNVLDVEGTGPRKAYDIERNGNANAQIVVLDNGTTINGTPITTNDFENEIPVAQFNGYYAVDVEVSSTGKYMSGTYSTNVSGGLCAEGYAAFANGTDPETWTVAPSYTIYYIANNTADERDTAYVLQSAPNHTVQANTFSNNGLIFTGWNTKADGTGTALAVNATMTLSSDTTLYAQWQGVAKIGDVHYVTLDAAVDAVQANETIEILADSVGITNTKVIPANVTITGQGKTATKMTIISSSGIGITINNPNVTLKDMTIDGSQITSGGYKTLVNVRADGCLITDVVMKKGGQSTWNSSILVETLPSTATFTVSNSTISGAFRGVLRESCSANIVITNCDIDAVYPFNIDGGSGGTVTVTGGALHGWTSYSAVDQVTFTNVDFSQAASGYNIVAAYVNTQFDNCTMSSDFKVYAQTSGFTFDFEDCLKDGVLVTNENFTEQFPADPDVWNNCVTIVNEVTLVGSQAQLDAAISAAGAADAHTRMTQSFEYNGALCGPTNKYLHLNCSDTLPLIMKNNGDKDVVLTQSGSSYTMRYTCSNGSTVALSKAAVAISEGTSFTTSGQTTFFTAAEGYYLIETDNWDNTYTYSVETLGDKVAINTNTGTYYTYLDDAIDEAAAGNTIRLLQDVTLTASLTIDKNITLDLNEKTISGSVQGLIKTNGDAVITLTNGTVTSTAARTIESLGNGVLNLTECTISGKSQMVYNNGGGATINATNSTLRSTGNSTIYHHDGVFNATNCTISCDATTPNNMYTIMNYDALNLTNCTVTGPSMIICCQGTSPLVNIDGGVIESKSYASAGIFGTGSITNNKGIVNIYGDAQVIAYYRAIQQSNTYETAGSVNIGGYMDEHGNLVPSGAPTIILKDTSTIASDPNAINVYYDGTVNIFGNATISTTHSLATAAVGCINGGTVNFTGGTIEGFETGVYTSKWSTPAVINTCYVNISDSARLETADRDHCVTTVGDHPTEIDIWGGTFSEDVSGEKCRDGYAAFANGTAPETWTVAPSYTVYYDANQPSGERDTVYVRQATPTHTAKPEGTFTYGTFGFNGWNTKADGTGTDVAPGTAMTLTTDTTLYAQWDYVARIGTTGYGTLAEAAAAVPTGTPTTITILKNLNFWDAAGNLDNKIITFTGVATDTLTLTDASHEQTAAGGSDLTFENITLKNDMTSDVYRGIIHLNKLTINNSEVIGFMMGYAETFTCNNCTFTKTGKYHLWTYGSNCTFNSCTFNSYDNDDCKAINVYKEGSLTQPYRVITFNDCAFNSTPAVTDLSNSAIQINSDHCCFVVNINNCTVDGYINNSSSITDYPNLVNNKTSSVATTLYIDGTQILKQGDCDPVAMIGDTYYATLQSAADAAYDMTGDVTIEIVKDIEGAFAAVREKSGLNLTINGNDHTLNGQILIFNYGNQDNRSLTIQNINFTDEGYSVATSTDALIYLPDPHATYWNPAESSSFWQTNGINANNGGVFNNYVQDVFIKNCTFTISSSSVAAVKSPNSAAKFYGVELDHITVSGGHSLAQFNAPDKFSGSDTAVRITNCTYTVNPHNGINITGGADNSIFDINNNTLTGLDGYALRIQNGGANKTTNLSDNTFTSGEGIILKNNSAVATVNISSGTYNGLLDKATGTAANQLFVLTGGTFTGLGGGTDEADSTIVKDNCAPGYGCYKDVAGYPAGWTVLKMNMLTFDANVAGATGTTDTLYFAPGSAQTCDPVPDCGFTSPDGVAFLVWNTKADGSGDTYAAGSSMSGINSDTVLYAQWDYVARNVNTNTYYNGLQAAIDDATAGDSIVLLKDITINALSGKSVSIEIVKSLIINGGKHTITSTATRGLWVNASNVNLTLRNFYLNCTNASSEGTRGVQLNGADGSVFTNNNLLMDSCRVTTAGLYGKSYAINLPCYGHDFTVTVKNSYIKGWAAVNNFASDIHFVFENDTLHGVNQLSTSTWDDFATINIDGGGNPNGCPGHGTENCVVDIVNTVVIAEEQGTCKQYWGAIKYSASNVQINVDCDSKLIDIAENDISEKLLIVHSGDYPCENSSITLPLATDAQKSALMLQGYALTDVTGSCDRTKVGFNVGYTYNNGNDFMYTDFSYPFNTLMLSAEDVIELLEDVVMTDTLEVDVNGNVNIEFSGHSITRGDNVIMIAEGSTVTTDERALELFSSTTGHVMERGNGNGTYTYGVATIYNVTSSRGYNDLQTAINTATPGDSLLICADLALTYTIAIPKDLKINGNKHVITTTRDRGLWFDEEGVTLNLKNFYFDGTGMDTYYQTARGIRAIQVDQNNVTLNMDSCRVYEVQEYAMYAFRDVTGANVNVENSYIEGRLSALRSYASNTEFSFINDSLISSSPCDPVDYATIYLDGNNEPTLSQNNNITIQECVIISNPEVGCDPQWLGIAFAAANNEVMVDDDTKIIDGDDQDITSEMNFWLGGGKNYVTIPLSAEQIEWVEDNDYTVTASSGASIVSAPVYWHRNSSGAAIMGDFRWMFIDFHSPFKLHALLTADTLDLDDNIALKDTVYPNGAKFMLRFNGYTITPGVNCIMLVEGDTVKTDEQTTIFCSEVGEVLETDNGNGTYTYAIAPFVAMNMNTHTGYANLQTAVDAVNDGDTIRILRNINLTSMLNVNASTVNNFTIDLNGDTISFSGSSSNDAAIRILNGAELTIKDRGTNGAIINPGKGSAVLGGYGTLVLDGGILEGSGSQTNALYLWATSASTMGSATINGGTLKSASGMAIRHRGDMLTINDGTFISGNNNVIQNQSTAVINGGTFTSNATYRYAIYNSGTITINDATTNGTGGALSNSGTMTVNDGTFTTNGGNAAYNSSNGVLTINDGEFQVSSTNGFRNIGANAQFYFNGGTITDAGVTQSVIYNTGKFVMTNVEVPATTADYTVWVDENGDFEAHGGKIMNTKTSQSALIYGDDGNAKITIDGTELIGTAANTYGIWAVGPDFDITMTSGSITTTQYCILNNGSNTTNTSKWVITGGTLESTESTAIYHAAPDSVIIGVDCTTGPTITGVNSAIEHRAGHLVIKGGTLTSTATPYSVTPNASGTTTVGAAVAVAQHTTAVETTVDISCGTFEGASSISIANPQGNTTTNVDATITGGTFTGTVHTDDDRIDEYITGGTFDDATVLAELESRIEDGYYAFDNGNGTVTVAAAWFLYYDKNQTAATGTMDTIVKRRDATDAERTITVADCAFTWDEYHNFYLWNSKADGTGSDIPAGSSLILVSDTTLYAIWRDSYTVTYHNNGGTGTIASQIKLADVDLTLSDGTGFSRTDSTLYRWNTAADESGVDYTLGATYSDNANLDLYAVWRKTLNMTMDSTDVVCNGENNGTDTVNIIGGEAPYQLVLSSTVLTQNDTATISTTQHIYTNLKPGTYNVQLTDVLTKDTIRDTFTIAEPDELLITAINVPDAPCPLMGTGTYAVSVTTTGGNGGNSYAWDGDATDVNDTETTVIPDVDDRDRTYTVTVTVTDSKNCSATQSTTFTVAPVIANDGTAHSNTTMTIATLSFGIISGCDTIIRDFGTPEFTFTNATITEGILDTIFNNVSTAYPDSLFTVGDHTIVWTARDTCGQEVTAEQTLTIYYLPCPDATDYEGSTYSTVRISCNCWTAENLRSTLYSDGQPIPDVMHYPLTTRATDPNGNLYTQDAALRNDGSHDLEAEYSAGGIQGACPTGWHLPTEAEMNELMNIDMSTLTTADWLPVGGNNSSGMTLMPSGIYNSLTGYYEGRGVTTIIWLGTPPSIIYHACQFGSACGTYELVPGVPGMGYSIRCVKD